MQAHSSGSTSGEPTAGQSFLVALRHVALAWLAGSMLTMLVAYLVDTAVLVPAFVVAIGSGLVALVAMAPVAWFSQRSGHPSSAMVASRADVSLAPGVAGDVPESALSGDLVSAFMLGTTLRLVGTVALFLLCRYQLGLQPEKIAALVGVWYVWMTSVEVVTLAKLNADLHRSRNHRQIWTTG
tara:strand:- start:625397 stop:625945 length:549 start_codon:yes stop_codon:yes gene_type:complete